MRIYEGTSTDMDGNDPRPSYAYRLERGDRCACGKRPVAVEGKDRDVRPICGDCIITMVSRWGQGAARP